MGNLCLRSNVFKSNIHIYSQLVSQAQVLSVLMWHQMLVTIEVTVKCDVQGLNNIKNYILCPEPGCLPCLLRQKTPHHSVAMFSVWHWKADCGLLHCAAAFYSSIESSGTFAISSAFCCWLWNFLESSKWLHKRTCSALCIPGLGCLGLGVQCSYWHR